MTTGERIKLLRKEFKLTQSEFGERIGLKQTAIGTYETGIRNVPDRTISQISQAFRIREEWLRFGEEPRDIPQVSSFLNDSDLDDLDRTILRAYIDLPSEKRQVLKDYILQVASLAAEKQQQAAPPAEEPPRAADEKQRTAPLTDEEIEAELADYRAELLAEREVRSVSEDGNADAKRA